MDLAVGNLHPLPREGRGPTVFRPLSTAAFLSCIGLLCMGSFGVAQERAITNDDVLQLVRGGLDEQVVIAKIRQAPRVAFRLDTDDLVRMKTEGTSAAVLQAMIDRGPAPPAHPFRLNARSTAVTMTVGPVTLRTVQFLQTRPNEIEALLDFHCDEGKDQAVSYEIVFIDANGAALFSMKGRKGVEENDAATAKQKQKLEAGFLERVRTFTISFTSVPD